MMKAVVVFLVFVISCTGHVAAEEEMGDNSCCDKNILTVDLTTGLLSGSSLEEFGASLVRSFTSGTGCDSRGVLKVTFDKPMENDRQCTATCNRRMLKVGMNLSRELKEGWLFNIGNSRTNKGSAGDDGTNTYDSEIAGRNNDIDVYNNDVCSSGTYARYPNATITVSSVNVKIASGFYEITTTGDLDVKGCNDTCLFDLSGKQDRELEGPNDFVVYVGFNGVVGTAANTGRGVCGATLSWECQTDSTKSHRNDVRAEINVMVFSAYIVALFYMYTGM